MNAPQGLWGGGGGGKNSKAEGWGFFTPIFGLGIFAPIMDPSCVFIGLNTGLFLLCNNVSHWLGANLVSALEQHTHVTLLLAYIVFVKIFAFFRSLTFLHKSKRRHLSARLSVPAQRNLSLWWRHNIYIPASKVHGANMGPTWVLSAPDGSHVGPMNLAIRDVMSYGTHHKAPMYMISIVFF